jgi:hypothetical protein
MTMATGDAAVSIPPYFYVHVLDQNTNVTRLEIGPQNYIRQDNERSVKISLNKSFSCEH